MDYAEKQRMMHSAKRADGDRFWFIDLDDWQGDLDHQEIRICDKNGKVLFTLGNGYLDHASYIIGLNNAFVKEVRDDSLMDTNLIR